MAGGYYIYFYHEFLISNYIFHVPSLNFSIYLSILQYINYQYIQLLFYFLLSTCLVIYIYILLIILLSFNSYIFLVSSYFDVYMCTGGYGVTSGVNSVTGGGGLHYGVAGRIPTTSTIYHMGTLSKVPNTN